MFFFGDLLKFFLNVSGCEGGVVGASEPRAPGQTGHVCRGRRLLLGCRPFLFSGRDVPSCVFRRIFVSFFVLRERTDLSAPCGVVRFGLAVVVVL